MRTLSLIYWNAAVIFCFFLAFVFGSCSKKQIVKKVAEEPTIMEEFEDVDSEELDIHGKDFVSAKKLASIHFDYDSSNLSQEARNVLSSNANYLKTISDLEILVEGHCDERGTVGYNLALGQERASTVRKYYISLGINPKMVGTISFGEEKPICIQNSEECWHQNRRAETKVRILKVVENNDEK